MKSFLILTVLAMILAIKPAESQDKLEPELLSLGDSIYVHTSAKILGNNTPYPSNGLLVNTPGGFVLIDTPWNDEQMQSLMQEVKRRFGKKIILAFITHAHEDRIGGIKTLLDSNIRVLSGAMTAKFAPGYGYLAPEPVFSEDTILNIGNIYFEIYYPGKGHTYDNTVVWLPQTRILFGGCLVKSPAAKDLGNLAEASLADWPKSLENVMKKFPEPRIIIPGHLPWATGDFIYKHTLLLIHTHR